MNAIALPLIARVAFAGYTVRGVQDRKKSLKVGQEA